jgi:hypothetical protein
MNRKTYHNDYGTNSPKCYNTLIKKTQVTYSPVKKPYYNYNSNYVLSGLDPSGSVYTNPQVYNVEEEDPGISWVL